MVMAAVAGRTFTAKERLRAVQLGVSVDDLPGYLRGLKGDRTYEALADELTERLGEKVWPSEVHRTINRER